jgi:hypothetical protein
METVLAKVRERITDPFMREKVVGLLRRYDLIWEGSLAGWKLLSVEKELFATVVNLDTGRKGRKYVLHGFIDKVLLDPNGDVVFFDHKTTSEDVADPDGFYWRRMEVDQQSTIYRLLLLANGISVKRIVWDAVKKPTIRPRMQETPEEYGERCFQWADQTTIVRQPIFRDDVDVYKTNQNIWDLVRQLQWMEKSMCWPMCPASCFVYNRICEYSSVCHGGQGIGCGEFVDDTRVNEATPAGMKTISHSSLSLFQSCPRKYLYRCVLRRVPAREDRAEALVFGSAWHAALDDLFKLRMGDAHGQTEADVA